MNLAYESANSIDINKSFTQTQISPRSLIIAIIFLPSLALALFALVQVLVQALCTVGISFYQVPGTEVSFSSDAS